MRLKKVRVHDFRCVEESDEFSVADVTALVGKNESGKTAILKALHKLKPENGGKETFEAARDYPRRKWRPADPVPEEPPAVETTWEMTDEEVAALEKQFGEGVLRSPTFTVSKDFENERSYRLEIDHAALLKHAIESVELTDAEREPVNSSSTVSQALKALEAVGSRTAPQEQLYQKLQADFPKGPTRAVVTAVDKMLPTFLYFSQYRALPGEVSVEDLVQRQSNGTLEDRHRIFIALLALAGTTPEKLRSAGTFTEFSASLRAVSNQISDMIFKYWSQNRHLDVEMRLDHARPNDPPPFNSGWVFRTQIVNRRHRADTSFDERSTGFVWFFSFLVWFNHLRDTYGKNLVILLDEPGLSLHAKAQADLLRYINEQLRPTYQVIYTTHSPFMIDPDNLLSARTVEDVVITDKVTGAEELLGTKVGENVLSTDPDTLFPLQRALGYELTQTLFVGRHTLLVEGASDLVYLKWFSRQLEKAGEPGLDYRWNISVVGGVDRIPAFVSLFRGNGLHIAAVTDVQTGLKQRIENARKALPAGHLLTLDEYAGQKEADIEDVLGREFYLAVVTKALDLRPPYDLPETRPAGAPERVVKEIDAHAATLPIQYRPFDHFVAAEWLFQHADEGAALPGFEAALERMGRLIADLNVLIDGSPRKSGPGSPLRAEVEHKEIESPLAPSNK